MLKCGPLQLVYPPPPRSQPQPHVIKYNSLQLDMLNLKFHGALSVYI